MNELICRGETIAHMPASVTYQKPAGLNWRYHAPGKVYGTVTRSTGIQRTPRATDWRYEA